MPVPPILTPSKAKSRVAVAHRMNLGPEVIAERRSDLVEANLAAAITRILADAPPLTDEQCDRLSAILRDV